MLELNADLALVVGGYNSSNTSHIKELCDTKFTSYFINGSNEIKDSDTIKHFDYEDKKHLTSSPFIPTKSVVDIVLTSGASCPDSVVEGVLDKILSFYPDVKSKEQVMASLA